MRVVEPVICNLDDRIIKVHWRSSREPNGEGGGWGSGIVAGGGGGRSETEVIGNGVQCTFIMRSSKLQMNGSTILMRAYLFFFSLLSGVSTHLMRDFTLLL